MQERVADFRAPQCFIEVQGTRLCIEPAVSTAKIWEVLRCVVSATLRWGKATAHE